jgi:hypothetical protein
VELMMNSGLKYVHASGKGRLVNTDDGTKRLEGDLEKSRKMVSTVYSTQTVY